MSSHFPRNKSLLYPYLYTSKWKYIHMTVKYTCTTFQNLKVLYLIFGQISWSELSSCQPLQLHKLRIYAKIISNKCFWNVCLVSYEHFKLKKISDQYLEQNNFVITFSNEDNESNFKIFTFDNVFFLGLYVVDIQPLYEVHH